MKAVEFSIRRPVTVFIFAVAAVVFGVVSFRDLAVDLLPDITYPSLTVRTEYPGTAPAEIESLLTKPIENAAGVVNSVVRVSSSSRADTSEVTLEFSWGTNMDFASLDVRERLDVVRLPIDADKPVLLRYDPSLDPVLRIGITGRSDLVRLRLLAEEEVKRALERVEGVAGALVSGGLVEEIQVEIDERKLASLGLNVTQVVNRLAQENVNLTGGRLREGQTEYLVRTINELLRADDLNRIVIGRSAGATIRLNDIARVVRGAKERDVITRINGNESVEVGIYKEGGTNTVTVVDAVRTEVDRLRDKLRVQDPTLELTVITDQGRYIRQSVREVINTAAIGGSLAILVLFLFLRSVKNTLIIGISIPVSVMATFFLMYGAGVSLNIMSLGGLTLGIGLLVDNSIVVLEAIQRKHEEGLSVIEAARVGASEVSRAVVASTITTVCVFAPIVFVEGIAGQLFGDQALTVTFSLLVSLAVALTVVPMLASQRFDLVSPPETDEPETARGFFLVRWVRGGIFAIVVTIAKAVAWVVRWVARILGAVLKIPLDLFDASQRALAAGYDVAVGAVLRRPVATLLVTLLLFAASLALWPRLGRELVPELIQGELFVNVEMTPGTRLEVTDRRLGAIERRAASLRGVHTVYTVVGSSSEKGGIAGENRENLGQVTVMLDPPISAAAEQQVIDQLRQEIELQNASFAPAAMGSSGDLAGATGAPDRTAMEYSFGRPSYFSFRTPIEIEIRGYNLVLLGRLADELVTRLRAVPGLVDIKSSTEGGSPELQIVFDRERLAAMGASISEIGSMIRSKIQGEVATDIHREDRNIDIRLRADESYRDSIKDLRNLNISRTGTSHTPLSSVAEIVETEGPADIRRADGSRIAAITANLVGRDLGSVSDDIEAVLEGMTFPSGFDWSVGGQREEMETSFSSMRLALVLAVFLVYLVMASQFESLLHPFVILFSIPFSVVGVLLALWLTDTAVSVVVLIGTILLAGIVVNNAIVLIDYTNQLRAEGMAKLDALRRAGRVRLRPILMTTGTTVLGLLPMAIGLGEGSELRAPMAITVVGGLLTSTLLTLLIIPVVYSVLDRSR